MLKGRFLCLLVSSDSWLWILAFCRNVFTYLRTYLQCECSDQDKTSSVYRCIKTIVRQTQWDIIAAKLTADCGITDGWLLLLTRRKQTDSICIATER